MTLTQKQDAFVREYLVDLNATQAAIRAGYSADTAHSQGPRLLEHAEVSAAVQAAYNERAARVGVQADTVLRECARLGLSDVRRLFREERLLAPHEWDHDTAAAVASVEVDSRVDRTMEPGDPGRVYTVTKIKLWDKNSALEKLCKHLGLFDKDNAQTKPAVTVVIRRDRGAE